MHKIAVGLFLALQIGFAADEPGFTSLFDGKTLNGWKLVGGHGPGYVVKDNKIVCPAEGGGNLFTEKEFRNFVFRFEFVLTAGANNGIGIRAPYEGDAAYQGMEIQILDDGDKVYNGKIRPEQYHGSVYDVIPARTGYRKPLGEWNEEEIAASGRHNTSSPETATRSRQYPSSGLSGPIPMAWISAKAKTPFSSWRAR
ncbi:MAG TPA: DUF1080 domain-containing protein [Candidatus Acidoferrales bacterium]|jgi:hypothetical protein|nr:DUF1080 domain-containing protein [Candidatus Acidoferrales bacterium]